MFAWRDNYISYNGAAAPATDPYWTSVQLLQNFDNNTAFTDSSSNNFRITVNGAPTPNYRTPFSGSGNSMYFSGSGAAWLSMPASSAWDLGTGNFTFECWVYVTNFSVNFGGYMPIVTWDTGSFKTFRVRPTAMNFETNVPTNQSFNANWPSTMTTDQWYHVALVRSNSTTVTAYLNGVAGGPVTIGATTGFGNATNVMNVGYKSDPGYWWGYMSNWRLVKGTAVYTSNFTPSTTPLTAISGTSGLLNFTNLGLNNQFQTFPDYGPYVLNPTFISSITYSSLSPFGNQYPGSYYFPATATNLNVASNAVFNYGAGDFTIECWFRVIAVGSTQYIIDQRNNGAAPNFNATIYLTSGGTVNYYSNGADRITGATTVTAGVWYHVAACRASSTTRLFLNGVQQGSNYSDGNTYVQTRAGFGFNANTTNSNSLNGYLSNIRLSKGFAYYTSNFTPSTVPLTSSLTYTSLLLSNNTVPDLSNAGQSIVMRAVANTYVTTSQAKFGTQSLRNQGTGGQFVQTTPVSTNLQFGTGDFTVECWVYRDATGATHTLMSKGSNTGPTGWVFQINSSNQLLWISGGSTLKTSTTAIAATTWTYVAVTRSGTTCYMFINGTQEGSTFTDSANYNQTDILYLGADRLASNNLVGFLDDARITVGVCRYTGTFSPPTQAFPTS